MIERLKFEWNRLCERLWVRPLAMCGVSILLLVGAGLIDSDLPGARVPDISTASLEKLLTVISSSMLVIATLAVTSMISAYTSASGAATPRAFRLVLADDVSQNALSVFIGAFIFSIVALVALLNDLYGPAGRFVLFVLTALLFGVVVLTFVRWVDRIARLGRIGETIDKVEAAAAAALDRRRRAPTLGALPAPADGPSAGQPVYGDGIGYVQRVDVAALQAIAEGAGLRITVGALPGALAAPGRALAWVQADGRGPGAAERDAIARAFVVGNERLFDEDPRFGLVVLSEIASRALSPGINDPGTAIGIIGVLVRLFSRWATPLPPEDMEPARFDRVWIPPLSARDLFDDAFTPIARDGAGTLEVGLRLLKGLKAIGAAGDGALEGEAARHARLALQRGEMALALAEDRARLAEAARFARHAQSG